MLDYLKDCCDCIQSYIEKIISMNIDLLVYNTYTKQKDIIVTKCANKFDKYVIIYGEYSENLDSCDYNGYFCDTPEDVVVILEFISSHPELFDHGPSEDILDNCETIITDLDDLEKVDFC